MSATQITRANERGATAGVARSGAPTGKVDEPAVRLSDPIRRGIVQDERTLFFSEKY